MQREISGSVDDGRPVPTSRIAADLKRSREATLANLARLDAGDYIERSTAAGHAYEYRVCILVEWSSG
jgi:DNA-binding Lrp family transcriptional regulator